ncbi:type 1 glutamine amidotransferase domain-containing protein [Corynebacterium sp. UMB9976]|uniref:type 1 glutamine amidotransferase domain-containing protein n=1 Tax=Corynebacterium sp. UMB9976 TaxID=3046354 RepID=UPI00255038B4|nr:type 1 glutamine amidotransferase domain-containing protein [Corynebacterium sp. UMB9976]MDK6301815.1 type 1 glutamine amidotransferase domain-containing protein [Corynebacterium sp. UMB9976]
MAKLDGKRIGVLATNGFEDSEFSSPIEAVRQAGGAVTVLSPGGEKIEGKNGSTSEADASTESSRDAEFDGIILPGGTGNADQLRMDEAAVEIVKKHVEAGKPLAVICHGAWILTDADVLRGRTLTSYPSLKTDLQNAGATWVDEEVHVDNGLVSSRTPADLEAFNAKLVEEFAEGQH